MAAVDCVGWCALTASGSKSDRPTRRRRRSRRSRRRRRRRRPAPTTSTTLTTRTTTANSSAASWPSSRTTCEGTSIFRGCTVTDPLGRPWIPSSCPPPSSDAGTKRPPPPRHRPLTFPTPTTMSTMFQCHCSAFCFSSFFLLFGSVCPSVRVCVCLSVSFHAKSSTRNKGLYFWLIFSSSNIALCTVDDIYANSVAFCSNVTANDGVLLAHHRWLERVDALPLDDVVECFRFFLFGFDSEIPRHRRVFFLTEAGIDVHNLTVVCDIVRFILTPYNNW